MHHIQKQPNVRSARSWADRSWSLQIALWLPWTLVVAATAYLSWHHDHIAHLPINTLGMVIHCLLIGVIGMIVITYIEMRIQP